MAENPEVVELARFEFDTDAIVKGAQVLKKAIGELSARQADLRFSGQQLSKEYIENEATLKSLNTEYRTHIKALSDTQKETQEQAIRTEKLSLVLNQEVKSIKQARDQNKELNKLRNTANLETAEGRQELEELNKALDLNNEFIRENVDAYTKQKINIGNYKEDIKSALEETNIFSGGVQGLGSNLIRVAGNASQAGGAGALFGNALQGVKKSLIGVTRAALAFIATPVGAVIAVLAGAFLLIKNAMDRSEESTNKLSEAFAPFKGILNAVLDALEPVGEFLIDGIVLALELAEKAVYDAIDAFASLAEFLGFDEFAEGVREWGDTLEESAAQAKELERAQQALTQAQREARLVQLEYQKEAENFRQIRDDESRTIAERIQANRDLGAVLDLQLQKELELANTALKVAELRIAQEGRTKEALDAQYAALTEIADIEERITGQRSEQLVNENSLRKEAADAAKEAAEARVKQLEDELALFEATQGFRKKDSKERLELAQTTADKELAILQEQLDSKLISEIEYEAERLNVVNDFAQQRAEILVENAEREIEALRRINELKRLEEGYLTEQLALDRIEANNVQLEREMEFFRVQLDQGLINQATFDEEIQSLKDDNRVTNQEIADEREALAREEELELRAIAFEEELARLQEEGATKFELEREIARENRELALEQLNEDRENQLISEEVFLARRDQINAQFNRADQQRDKILKDQKLANASTYLGAVGRLIDAESGAGKSIALAQTGISTYRGIAKELEKGFPAAIPGIALVSATGIKSALDITKTKVPSATGRGEVGGGTGGINLSNTGNLSGQGLGLELNGSDNGALQTAIENSTGGRQAEQIGEAVRQGAQDGTQQGSQDGIREMSDNRAVANESGL